MKDFATRAFFAFCVFAAASLAYRALENRMTQIDRFVAALMAIVWAREFIVTAFGPREQ